MLSLTVEGPEAVGRHPRIEPGDAPTEPAAPATLRELLAEIHRAGAIVSAAAARAIAQLDDQQRRAGKEADG